jgi:hypothetical protein
MKRRFSFAAPLVLVAACHHGGGPTITHNPPPQPAAHYADWQVSMQGDTCYADDATPIDCPPDASCNPPAPMTIACPDGITEDAPVKVYQEQENGPCAVEGGAPIDCPSYE